MSKTDKTAKAAKSEETANTPKGPARSKAAIAAHKVLGMPESMIPKDSRTPLARLAIQLTFNRERLETQVRVLEGLDALPKGAEKPHKACLDAYKASLAALVGMSASFKTLVQKAGGWESEVRTGSSASKGPKISEGDYVSLPDKVHARLVQKGKIPAAECTLRVEWIEGGYASLVVQNTAGEPVGDLMVGKGVLKVAPAAEPAKAS